MLRNLGSLCADLADLFPFVPLNHNPYRFPTMSIKLRELIRAVRACKTAQEERAVIAKECALIRTAFKDNNLSYRHRNVAKLLFIHMLGYPSHFGQMECLKLIASPNFPEKRIGYLALMLLLDERTEVLTLVTNSLKNDLEHENQFVVGLSLTSVGNLATADMARTLCNDVAKHLGSNPYIRKKAALAMIRILKRVPDLAEDYVDRVVGLLKDRSHGVLITAVQLMADMMSPTVKGRFARVVPSLVKMLRNLLNLGYSPEHDIAGIADPFLQVKLLRLLQMLGHKNDEASEAMNDVLAQVATNTETNRNAGNAILYECVRTIMTIESESGLRVLAVNILGRFLLNRDNNIRYVALNSLSKVVVDDPAAVQRHRSTILDCLKDPDVSIRQRALELTYQLVNAQNVTELAREMLNYLVVAPPEHREQICSRVATVVDKFAPSSSWRLETLVTMLGIAGNHCDDSVASSTVAYVCMAPETQAYISHKLFHLLRDELPQVQIALMHVAVWCIGEFGDLLLNSASADVDDDQLANLAALPSLRPRSDYEPIPVAEILGLLEAVLKSHLATTVTKAYVLTALVKCASKLPQGKAEALELVAAYKTSMSLELQQRSCEYESLLDDAWGSARSEALARMPAFDAAAIAARRQGNVVSSVDAPPEGVSLTSFEAMPTADTPVASGVLPPASSQQQQPASGLLDLDDIFGGGGGAPPPSQQPSTPSAPPPPSDVDLLSDIFAAQPAAQPAAVPPAVVQPAAPPPDIFGGGPSLATQPMEMPAPPSKRTAPGFKAFEKDGLVLTMECSREGPGPVDVLCTFKNMSQQDMDRLVFQAAVPKYVTMEMKPASGAALACGGVATVTQLIKVTNTVPTKPLMMRLKIRYVVGGKQFEEQAQVSSFPNL